MGYPVRIQERVMNNIKRFSALASSVFLLFTVFSCSIGLDPAKSSGTTVSLQLASLVPSGGDRAVIQGTGYLYIQTGSTTSDAKLYGPWEAGSGDKFSTDEIPAGNYDSFSIIYMDSPKLDGPLYVDSDYLTVLSALQSKLSDFPRIRESCSCATLSGVSIRPNRENPVKATLVPATTTTINDGYGYLTFIPAATGGLARRFFKITPITAISNGKVLDFLTFSLVADGPLSVSRVAVYGLDGTLIGVDNKSVTLLDLAYSSWNIPCHSLRDTSCYVYIEYSGSIAATSVFNQAYMISSRPVWYVSNSGGSDGSDPAHPCTLLQAVECINNSSYSGTSSIILTGDIDRKNTEVYYITKDVRLSSLGWANYKIINQGTDNTNLFVVTAALSIANCTIDGGSGFGKYANQLVDVNSGSLTLESGATLQNNGASNLNGGAIMVYTSASVVMLPGSIIKTCTAGNGGGVYVYGGTFIMEGGSILSCPASTNGGAVFIESGIFTMKNGNIGNATQGPSAYMNGGAIAVSSGVFTLENGIIEGCAAINGNGGAIWVNGVNATAELTGGNIKDCRAMSTVPGYGMGGAVYVSGSSAVVDFATTVAGARTIMSGNNSYDVGHLLFKDSSAQVRVNGSLVTLSNFLTFTGYSDAPYNITWN